MEKRMRSMGTQTLAMSRLVGPSPDTFCNRQAPLILVIHTSVRRSIYSLSRGEISRGLANRFVHSRVYICLYLSMAALSVTTVILSLKDGCPGLAFFILEFIINVSMILEVAIRFVAFGRVSFTQL